MEIWKVVPGFEEYFEVSNFGRIKRLAIQTKRGFRKEKICLPFALNIHGYATSSYTKNNKRITFYLHRMVALAFIENPLGLDYVNHKDGNKGNNSSSNLEWVTQQENVVHCIKNNLTKSQKETHYNAKLTNIEVKEIRSSDKRTKELVKLYKVSKTTIKNIRALKTWKNLD